MNIPNLSDRAREYFTQNLFSEAIALYHKCIEIESDNLNNYWYLGLALLLSGEELEAQEVWMSVLINNPAEDFEKNSNALKNFLRNEADRFYVEEKLQPAEIIYRQIIELDTNDPKIYCNLGFILAGLNRLKEASEHFQQAIAFNPNIATTWRGLADSLFYQGETVEAIACYKKAIELGLCDSDTFSHLGHSLQRLGDYRAAISYYQEAMSIEPQTGTKIRQAIVLPIIAASNAEIESARLRLEEQIDALLQESLVLVDPVNEVDYLCFYLAYQGKNDRQLLLKMSQLYEQACPSLLWTAPHSEQATTFINSRKIKIGFFSSFFTKTHTISKLNRGLIAQLSREKFSVFVFSTLESPDLDSEFLEQNADEVITIKPDLETVREAIAQYELDILFYPEIGMDHFTYLLAYARLAHIQCVTWGHPVTTGIRNIDYFFSNIDLEPKNAQEHYSEKLIRLNKLPVYYYKPKLPEILKSRRDFNFTEEHHLYICPQSLFKFHPDFDELLGRILESDPLGRLVLIQSKYSYWQEQLMARFQKTLLNASDRVIFLPHLSQPDFLNLLLCADVMLDPIHFGGGNTNYEAFALGVPIVTWPSQYMRGRVAYACYQQMGFTECIATSSDEYIEIALRLGTNSSYRQQVSQEIISRNHLLFEDEAVVREIEKCLIELVHQKSEQTSIELPKLY